MADNAVRYGFRWLRSRGGGGDMVVERAWVATSASFDVASGASNCVLGIGDPIFQQSDGSVTLCLGNETTDSSTVLGIVCGFEYKDTVRGVMTKLGPGIPSDLAWGTNLAFQSRVLYCPIQTAVWGIQVDDATTFTTEATYQAAIGENCEHILTGASGELRVKPKLDISQHATTNTFLWKIIGIDQTVGNQDFAGANVSLQVISNGTLASQNAILGI